MLPFAVAEHAFYEVELCVIGVVGDIFVDERVGFGIFLFVNEVVDHETDVAAVFFAVESISLFGDVGHILRAL